MSAEDFLDTNVLVYAFSIDPRNASALDLLGSGCTISTQGLNEFTNIARLKLGMSWTETEDALHAIRTLSGRIVVPSLATHEHAIAIARQHGFSIFDAHMVATALDAWCSRFCCEDLHDGMLVAGRLRIFNPFRKTPTTPASA